jgi:uncharacterized membrane protein
MVSVISTLLAKIAAIIMILSIALWPLGVCVNKVKIKSATKVYRFYEWNKKYHAIMGKVMILAGVAHGILAPQNILSLNWGTACIVCAVLLGASSAFKKESNEKAWVMAHRILSVIAFAAMVMHIVNVA